MNEPQRLNSSRFRLEDGEKQAIIGFQKIRWKRQRRLRFTMVDAGIVAVARPASDAFSARRRLMEGWVEHYNNVRLNSAFG